MAEGVLIRKSSVGGGGFCVIIEGWLINGDRWRDYRYF